MPRALAQPLRERIVDQRQQGLSLRAIAQQMGLVYGTVRAWWARFRRQATDGLKTHYDRCGPRGSLFAAAIQQEALQMKKDHPRWGGTLVRLQLAERFVGDPLPGVRTLQSWWKAAGLQPPRAQQPPVPRQRGRVPHDVWQIDAKEQVRLGDRTGSCVLTVTDEASGALVGLLPFPPLLLDAGSGDCRTGGAAGTV
jgi:transposase